jgi:NADPH:quinone reductase-like Zn-dependent oxidoreductase
MGHAGANGDLIPTAWSVVTPTDASKRLPQPKLLQRRAVLGSYSFIRSDLGRNLRRDAIGGRAKFPCKSPADRIYAPYAVRNNGDVLPGQKVLIIGAAGGVGSFAVQIAKAFGAHVTGVCSTTKVDLVRSIGADTVIDYTRHDFVETGQRYDIILDIAGNRSVSHLRRALGPRGTLVIVGGEGGGRWFGGIDRQLRASMLSPFVSQKLGTFVAKANGEDLVVLTELIEAGKVTPVVGKAYPLSEVPEAIRHLEEGHARGKVAITV